MYPVKVDSRKFIDSLYEEFGVKSPLKLTEGKKSRIHSKVKKKKKSSFKDTKKRKVKRK